MFSWLLLIQCTYGVVSTIFYTLTVIVLIANWKQFDIYFFKLYIYQFFTNLWMYWNFSVTWRFPTGTCAECPLSSWFFSMSIDSSFSFPFYFFMFLHYHFVFINYSNALMTSLNRWTMIFMNKIYAQIWHYGNYPLIIISIVIPLFFTRSIIHNAAYFEYNSSTDTFVSRSTADLSYVYLVLLIWMIVSTVLNVVLNISCWIRISKQSQIARQKSDYRLFLVSFVCFLTHFITFLIGILNKISTDVDPSKLLLVSRIGQVLSPFGNDLLCLTPPFILVVFSKKIWHYGNYPLIFISIVIPLVWTQQLLYSDAYYEYNSSTDTFVARTTADLSQIYSVLLSWMVLSTVLNVILNISCWIRISKQSQIARQKSDYRLFLISFVTFLIHCLSFALGVSSSSAHCLSLSCYVRVMKQCCSETAQSIRTSPNF